MTAVETAIQDAVKGRYNREVNIPSPLKGGVQVDREISEIFLDRLFWQALGKSRGWARLAPYELVNKNIPEWHYHWHRFIDALAEGQTAEDFFKSL